VFGKEWNSQILVKLPVTNVSKCIGSNTKTLGLEYLQFPDLGASGGIPDGAGVDHYRTDKFFIHQTSISDGDTTPV
jgi:hypothetical protein